MALIMKRCAFQSFLSQDGLCESLNVRDLLSACHWSRERPLRQDDIIAKAQPMLESGVSLPALVQI